MNNWKEFDYIKTPNDWKDISLEKKAVAPKYRLSFVMTMIILCISLSSVVAYHNELEEWLNSVFQKESIHKTDNTLKIKNENMVIIEPFIYEYEMKNDEEVVKSVYSIQNHQLQQMSSLQIEGYYHKKKFSFNYIVYNNHIFGYQFQGNIEGVLPLIVNNNIYLMSEDNDLIEMNLKTKQVKAITSDHQSVNPIMSPNGKTILINKSDQYWTVYDTHNQSERKVEDIDGIALSNEIYFIDDYTVSTYHTYDHEVTDENGTYRQEECQMYIIDLKTLKKKVYNEMTEFASPIVIQKDQQVINIKNILTNQKCEMKTNYQEVGFYMTRGYILFFGNGMTDQKEENISYLYSIEDNQYFTINMPKEIRDITDMSILDESHELLITDENYVYLIDIQHLFN